MSSDLEIRWKTLHNELLLFSIFSRDESDSLKSEVGVAKITSALGALRLVQVFDWNGWIQDQGGWPTIDSVEHMDLNDCVRTLTAIVRSNRFNEGVLADAVRSGMVNVLVRRSEKLSHGLEIPSISDT